MTRKQALSIIETAFMDHATLDVECNGIDPYDVISYLRQKGYDFECGAIRNGSIFRITAYDIKKVYVEVTP